MFMSNHLIGFGASSSDDAYTTSSIRVNGDRVSPSLTSAPSAATKGLWSCWIKPKSLAADGYVLQQTGNALIWALTTAGAIDIQVFPGVTFANGTSGTHLTVDVWSHVAMSWDIGGAVGKMVIDGVTQTFSVSGGSSTNWTTGQNLFAYQTGAAALLDAEVADWYLNVSDYLDISVAGNLQKFRTTGGKPVSLGATGALPTGNQPQWFFKGPAATWNTNLGTLGNSTTTTGALADGATSPSD